MYSVQDDIEIIYAFAVFARPLGYYLLMLFSGPAMLQLHNDAIRILLKTPEGAVLQH